MLYITYGPVDHVLQFTVMKKSGYFENKVILSKSREQKVKILQYKVVILCTQYIQYPKIYDNKKLFGEIYETAGHCLVILNKIFGYYFCSIAT